MTRLNSLQGAESDSAFADAQLRVQSQPSLNTAPIPRTATTALYAVTRNGRYRSCSHFWRLPSGSPAAAGRQCSKSAASATPC